jgi:hypothetical protein
MRYICFILLEVFFLFSCSDRIEYISEVQKSEPKSTDSVLNVTIEWANNDVVNSAIKELYIPNADKHYQKLVVHQVEAVKGHNYKLFIKNADGTDYVTRAAASFTEDSLNKAIVTLYSWHNDNIVGYVIFNDTIANFSNELNNICLDLNAVSNINNSPNIKKMLRNPLQVLLIGDSFLGYKTLHNSLEHQMQYRLGCKVFNLGCSGCWMAYRKINGKLDNSYNAFAFPSIVDALLLRDYKYQKKANDTINTGHYNDVLATLLSNKIDLSKPTILICEYGNNDLTCSVPIGNLWNYKDKNVDYDKYTVLGAMNYGVNSLLTAYPHIKIIQLGTGYRYMKNPSGDYVPPYAYNNGLYTPRDLNDSIRENCYRLGISYEDFNAWGVRNAYSVGFGEDKMSKVLEDNSHFNTYGFYEFAKYLSNLVKQKE